MKNRVYGYVRISTMKQKMQRQIDNIKRDFPDAIIICEAYTGTTTDRPKWCSLKKQLKQGDTVVFDEVSRMSRNAEEGFQTYKELYNAGVNLVFLKEPQINTSVFRETAQLATVGNDIADIYIEATNKVLMLMAEKQIRIAFDTAQAEVDFLHQRTSEGVRKAQAEGRQVGRATGQTVITKKSKDMKAKILKMSRDFGGSMTDREIIETLGIARNTFYKYKAELKNDMIQETAVE